MSDETRARAFDLFFTTKDTGTGLGMAIARAVIEQHGGRIEIRSQIGGHGGARAAAGGGAVKPEVLVVDDEPSIAEALRLILERDGYVVETARNITEASARMDGHDFSVALVDLVLPDGTVWDF